ncbi:MAG: sialate O-acetylesterase, partial [Tannerellaceae bacterium]|nr:sialate O-acetylesterase [Tannerellaceae bacterium]
MKLRYSFLFGVLLLLTILPAPAQQLSMPAIFGDNMVLQRDAPVRMWGNTTGPGRISIRIAGQTFQTFPDEKGYWETELPPQKATTTPFSFSVYTSTDTLTFGNVITGDVWLASGQSNMQMRMNEAENAPAEIREANHPGIRFFQVRQMVSHIPLDDLEGEWKICRPENAGHFSAVAYYFAREIWEKQQIPAGIISASWGGTPSQAWTSAEMLKSHPDFTEKINETEQAGIHWQEAYLQNQQEHAVIRNSNRGIDQGVHRLHYKDTKWTDVTYP